MVVRRRTVSHEQSAAPAVSAAPVAGSTRASAPTAGAARSPSQPFPQQHSHTEISQIVDDVSVQTTPTPWFKKPFLKLPVWTWIVAVLAVVGIGVAVSQSGGRRQVHHPRHRHRAHRRSRRHRRGGHHGRGQRTHHHPARDTPTRPPSPSRSRPRPASASVVAGAPAGERGTQDSPVAPGAVADIGAGWRLQVLDYLPDAAAAIAAENEFNDPPPAGQHLQHREGRTRVLRRGGSRRRVHAHDQRARRRSGAVGGVVRTHPRRTVALLRHLRRRRHRRQPVLHHHSRRRGRPRPVRQCRLLRERRRVPAGRGTARRHRPDRPVVGTPGGCSGHAGTDRARRPSAPSPTSATAGR